MLWVKETVLCTSEHVFYDICCRTESLMVPNWPFETQILSWAEVAALLLSV